MIQFYKPNARSTGSACSFWINQDKSIMASLIKQDSWNSEKRLGSFSKNKDNPMGRVIVKLNRTEIGGIIDTIESNRKFSTYHSSQNQVLQINFGPYISKDNNEQKGFSFSVNKQDKEDSTKKVGFIIGFTFPEARMLKHDLEVFLDKSLVIENNRQSDNKRQDKRPVKEVDLSEQEDDEDIAW